MAKILSFALLTLLAIGALLFPAQARRMAGLRPLATPSVADLDTLRQLQEVEAGSFFDDRSRIEIKVPRKMTLDEFLRLYNIRLPHVRAQMQQQFEEKGGGPLTDQTVLPPGESFTITLTPPQGL